MASYRNAIRWIAEYDDTEWLQDENPVLSVTASLVADVFDKSEDRVIEDLRRACRVVELRYQRR